MNRRAHRTKMEVDLTKPLDLSTVKADDGSCFGKMFDPRTDECQSCADSDVCCILYERIVKKKVRSVEEEKGPFLDTAGMHRVTDEMISAFIRKHKKGMSTESLVDKLLEMAGISDTVSAVERIKRYKLTGLIRIKNGIVNWIGDE